MVEAIVIGALIAVSAAGAVVVRAFMRGGSWTVARGADGPPPRVEEALAKVEVAAGVPAKLAVPAGEAVAICLRFEVVYRRVRGSGTPFGLVVAVRGGRTGAERLDHERLVGLDAARTGTRPVGGKHLPRWGKRDGAERKEVAIVAELAAGGAGEIELLVDPDDRTTLLAATAFAVARAPTAQ